MTEEYGHISDAFDMLPEEELLMTEQERKALEAKEFQVMTKRNFTKELNYYIYNDPEYGDDVESIDYRSLIHIITELCDRIEELEKDNELLKSYAWEQ